VRIQAKEWPTYAGTYAIVASDELSFPGLRPVPEGARGIEVDEEGTVLTSEEKRQDGPGFERIYPSESALLLGASFQRQTKKAEVLLFPLRWMERLVSRRLPCTWSSRGRGDVAKPQRRRIEAARRVNGPSQ
jgi:hypothetical protein